MRLKYSIPIGVILWISISFCKTEKKTDPPKKPPYAQDELTVQKGQDLFVTHCANCHSFEENNIGPNLAGITSSVDKEWIVKFIKNPIAVIKSGDPRANEQYARYKQFMPPFAHLKEEEIVQILSFVHKFTEGEKKTKINRPGALLNPIKEKIPTSDITLVLKEWIQMPASSDAAPTARINKMYDHKGKKGNRLFVHDLRGKIYEIINDSAQVYFDVKARLPKFIDKPGHATGLGSFTLHPDFESNGLLYSVHTEPDSTAKADFPTPDSVKTTVQYILTEWKTNEPNTKSFTGTSREIMRVDMNTNIHGMQDIAFNPLVKRGDPDYGNLYIGIGDGGAALTGHSYMCDSNYIWGKVIRINPLGNNSKNRKYGIPSDNPYTLNGKSLAEIWCSGFRNPHIITWDRSGSGQMFITNIGQHSIEEMNIGIKGAHYGWPYREGSFIFDEKANVEVVYPLTEVDTKFSNPAIQYDHDEGNAICGGNVYTGKIKPLKGKYIFGDIPRGYLFFSDVKDFKIGSQAPIQKLKLEINGKRDSLETTTTNARVDLRIGTDLQNEMYIMTKCNGKIYKIVDAKLDSE